MTRICLIILAAGAGSRFGGPKALASWHQGTLLTHATALAPENARVLVVTGAHRPLLQAHLDDFQEVHNADWADGMGTSIAAGIAAAQGADVALILPVDQPFVTQAHLEKLVLQAVTGNNCVLTQDGDITGPPAAVPARFFGELLALRSGGLKKALRDYSLCSGTGMLRDIDTQEDLKRYAI